MLGSGRAGAALARAAAASVRARVAAALTKTAWDKVLDQVRPDGSVGASTALQAFSLAVAPLPGVRVPSGPAGPIPDGTLAIAWVLSTFDRLTPAQRAAVMQALDGLHGTLQHAFRRPAGIDPVCAKSGDWQQDATYQQIAEQEASAIAGKLNLPLALTLCVGVGITQKPTSDAETIVLNGSGGWTSGPPVDCWITVGPSGFKKSGAALDEILAHEVFHCFQGQIAGLPSFYGLPRWVQEGGADWAACNVVSGALPESTWKTYLASPDFDLFQRTYSAVGFFSLLSQHGIDLWSRWPAILVASKNTPESAYQVAVGAQEESVLSAWAASYAQNVARGSDWDVAGPCKPAFTYAPRTDVDLADGTDAKLKAPEWAASLYVPYSSTDVVRITAGSGHVRLSSGALDVGLHDQGEADYCTSAEGDCTCPGSSKELQRINGNGGTLIAMTGGPTGADATVTGMSLESYCHTKTGGGSCSALPAKALLSILGLTTSAVLDAGIVSSDKEPGISYQCDLGAWSGAKPTTAAETLQRARSGKAAAVSYETWAQNTDQWPKRFAEMTSDFDKGVIVLPGPYADAGWSVKTFQLQHFGHEGGKGIGLRSAHGLTQGLVGAGGCWWDSSTLTAICIVDIEASNKPILTHLNQLAAIAVRRFLG